MAHATWASVFFFAADVIAQHRAFSIFPGCQSFNHAHSAVEVTVVVMVRVVVMVMVRANSSGSGSGSSREVTHKQQHLGLISSNFSRGREVMRWACEGNMAERRFTSCA
jgi:hypothetical protein